MAAVAHMEVDELGATLGASALAVDARPPAQLEDEAWELLRGCVRAVFAKEALPGASREEVYQLVEALCLSGCAPELCSRLCAECRRLTASRVEGLAGSAAEDALLERVASAWLEHCDAMRQLERLFMFLDRSHLLAHGAPLLPDAPRSLWQCGLTMFRLDFEAKVGVLDKVLYRALLLVDDDRRRALSDAGLALHERCEHRDRLCVLGAFAGMLVQLGLYSSAFESRLLDRATAFYRAEGESLIRRLPVAAYLEHCESRMAQEGERCLAHMQASTADALVARVRAELVQRHVPELLRSGFGVLVEGHKVADLARLYRLFGDVGETQALKAYWAQIVRSTGARIMDAGDAAEASQGVVPRVIQLHRSAHEILKSAFEGSADFGLALKDAFESFLNAGAQTFAAKVLARHIDGALERAITEGSEEFEKSGIDDFLAVFRHLSAKDAFEAFFRRDFARRLLLHRSASVELEELLLQRFRSECGSGYTSKAEGMLRDLRRSKSLLEDFAMDPDAKAAVDEAGVELDILALTAGLWPPQPASGLDVTYPAQVCKLQDMFGAFYKAKQSGRSLTWTPLGGQCTLRACFDGHSRKELVVSVLQALVLLLFNRATQLTVEEIRLAIGMDRGHLHRTLQSLALHKTVKVLIKEAKGREIVAEDVFVVNSGFSHKSYRVVVPHISLKEPQEDEDLAERRVFENRQHEVDAVIVRKMKTVKSLSHEQLVSDVLSVVRFPVQLSELEQRIESLIQREYLERDAKEPAMYHYLA